MSTTVTTGSGRGVRQPALLSGIAATVASLAAVWLVSEPAVRAALLMEGVGVVMVTVGVECRRRHRLAGTTIGLLGASVVLGAIGFAAVRSTESIWVVRTLPGLLGTAVLASGVVPVRGVGSRRLVKIGTAMVFFSVLVAGALGDASGSTLLASGAATIVAWDAGEQAINVGRHLGRIAETWRVELVHLGATVLVGVVAVELGRRVPTFTATDFSLTRLGLLLVGVILLTITLHD